MNTGNTVSSTIPIALKDCLENDVIKPGDTIFSVCKKYKLNMKELLIKNHIKDSNKIVTGQTLNLL